MGNVREFGGTGVISCSIGTLNGIHSGAFTFVVIAKLTDNNGQWREVLGVSTGISSSGNRSFWRTNTNQLSINTSGSDGTVAITWAIADGWVIIALNKAAGTAALRGHKCVLSTNTWTHTNGSSHGDAGANVLDLIRIGSTGYNDDKFPGRMLVVGFWKSSLSDATIESLRLSIDNWSSANELFVLDQSSVASPISSLTGTSSQTAISGTSVVTTDDPPLPTDFWGGEEPEVHSGGSTTGITVTATGAGSPTLSGHSEAEIEVSCTGAGFATVEDGSVAVVTVSASGDGEGEAPHFSGGSVTGVGVGVTGAGQIQAFGGSVTTVLVSASSPEPVTNVDVTIEFGPTRVGSVLIGTTRRDRGV